MSNMSNNNCPKCGHTNRSGARFCAGCGATLAPPDSSVSSDEVAEKVKQAASKAGAAVGPAASKAASSASKAGKAVAPVAKDAAAAVTPVAKEAAAKGWAGSKRGMGLFARIMTMGGRAAYSEVFSPLPAARGQVTTQPTTSTVPTPIDPAALLFVLSLFVGWSIFSLTMLNQAIALGTIFVVLLLLSWLGIRRPFFTKLTFSGLLDRLRRRGQTPQAPILKFRIKESASGQPLDVAMLGERDGAPIVQGSLVELWGIHEPGQNQLRAWKAEIADASGQIVGSVTTPRLLPLTVALFVPAFLLLLVWLVTLIP